MKRLDTTTTTVLAGLVAGLVLAAVPGIAAKAKSGPYAPHIDPANFGTVVDNPYFPLVPGTRFEYRETDRGVVSTNEVTVLAEKKTILGVACTVVHDVVLQKGQVKEDTFDWYAQDKQGNVWYFGEATKEFLPRGKVTAEGSWEAGVAGGQPGMFMAAAPAAGEPYRQEYKRGVAEDMAQVVGVDDSVSVPLGAYPRCVKTKDWSLLEAGSEFKWYARGVGLVRSKSDGGELAELVSITKL